MDSLPASKRPYIGSSDTNSVLNLAFGYNGVSRLTGDRGTGGGGGMFNLGTAGPLRLFQSELSGQASWLLPFVLFGCIGLFANLRRKSFTQAHKEALFWLAWLIPVMGFFSIAGFFHQYYLVMMAPPIAALVGAGWSRLWSLYRERTGPLSWLLPAATLVTALFQWYIIHPYDDTIGRGWSIGVLAAGIIVALLLVFLRRKEKSFIYATGIAVVLVLLIGPLYWAAIPITYGMNSQLPEAGPSSSNGMGGGPSNSGRNSTTGADEGLVSYLEENNTGEPYLFAALNYSTAAPYIIDKGASVVILNGYSSSDPVYTADTLKELVESEKVKYFLVNSGGMGGGREGNSELTSWITENGTEIPSTEWSGSGSGNTGTLYKVTLD